VRNLLTGDRGFGIVFTILFVLLGLRYRFWPAFGISAVFLAAALLRPRILSVLNRCWMRLAGMLARVTNPIMTAGLFYLVVTPMGLAARALGKDSLRRKIDAQAATYWLARSPPGSMKNQF